MEEVYIMTKDLPLWVCNKYFKKKDLVTIGDLVKIIEDLDYQVESTIEEYEHFQKVVEDNYTRNW